MSFLKIRKIWSKKEVIKKMNTTLKGIKDVTISMGTCVAKQDP